MSGQKQDRIAGEIERLQAFRQRRERAVVIGADVLKVQREADRTARRLCKIVDVWDDVVDADVRARTVIVSLRAGTLHVEADSASTRYDLDRRLRGGLLAELRSRSPVTLVRVRVTVGGRSETPAGDGARPR